MTSLQIDEGSLPDLSGKVALITGIEYPNSEY
jgi:hypothetical protein